MKLCKFLAMLMLLFIASCSTPTIQFDEGVRKLAYNILDNPDKLMDIEANYPEYYDKNVLLDWMRDTVLVKHRINQIKTELSPGIFGYCLTERLDTCDTQNIISLYGSLKLNVDTSKYKILRFELWKKDRALRLVLLDRDSKYFLMDVRFMILWPSPFD